MDFKCPGSADKRTPALTIKKCPQCGAEVEVFSIDFKVDCPHCGQPVFNNVNSCVEHCEYAEKCLGVELYNRYKKRSNENNGGV